MDMTMSMAMSSTAPSAMATMAMPSSSITSPASMDMSMGMASRCKISMTWNWYTVDACFISTTWRVTSPGIFAVSCIGVILLTMSLELVRRAQREYERACARADAAAAPSTPALATQTSREELAKAPLAIETTAQAFLAVPKRRVLRPAGVPPSARAHTLILRQVVRTVLHTVQFAVAYFVMLLAMYYNGYIIICILIGAFVGFALCTWDQVKVARGDEDVSGEVTGCCG